MWIGRRLDTTVYGAWSTRQPDDADHPRQEEVTDSHPDLLSFLAPKAPNPRIVADQVELDVGKADGIIIALINQTRAEWVTWAAANFPTLTAPERTKMGMLCWLLAIAIRKEIR